MAEADVCFICLSDEQNDVQLGPLGRHCQCKALFSHRSCLTRWQLQNAGKAEEKQCRFCKAELSCWKNALAEVPTTLKRSAPIMAVVFQGKTIKVPVLNGPEGVAEFKRTVCKLFNLPEGTEFEVTFECKSPVFGDKLHLKGFDCFEAASYCAAVSAAKRSAHKAAKATGTSGCSSTSSTTPAAGAASSSAAPPAVFPTGAPLTSSASSPLPGPNRAAAQEQQEHAPAAPFPVSPVPSSSSTLVCSRVLSSPRRLIRHLSERLAGTPSARPRSGGSNLRHSTQQEQAALSAPAQAVDSSLSSGSLTPVPSGASTPTSSGNSAPSGTSHKLPGGAMSFMRRLRAGILCTSPAPCSRDAHVEQQQQQGTLTPSSSSGTLPDTAQPAAYHHQQQQQQQAPVIAPLAAQLQPGQVPCTPSASLPSAATMLLQEPSSPAHSVAAHHENPPPAAHVATTAMRSSLAGTADEEAGKSSGPQLTGSLVQPVF